MKRTTILLTNLLITFVCSAQGLRPLSTKVTNDENSLALLNVADETDIDYIRCADAKGKSKPGTEISTAILITEIPGQVADTVKLTVYPNPNKGHFTITANKESQYLLMNILGDVVQRVDLSEMNEYSVTIQDLGSGVYFIRDENNRIRQRIIVTR